MTSRLEETIERIREVQTNGANYGVTPEDVIARLRDWSARCSFEVTEVEHDSLIIQFLTLPEDLDAFAAELDEFCPDVIDQHFGCFEEMIEAMEELGQEVSEATRELIDGVDLTGETSGMELLKRALQRGMSIQI